jgi:ATP-dependent Clp protease ATP-binding subunit ClpA
LNLQSFAALRPKQAPRLFGRSDALEKSTMLSCDETHTHDSGLRAGPLITSFAGLSDSIALEDLTRLARSAKGIGQLVSELAYGEFFDLISRCLRRSLPRHVLLVREPGVGERVALLELARRGVNGNPPYLDGKQFINLDCRRIPAKDVPSVIDSTFSALASRDDTILCVDGLFTTFRTSGNSAALSWLVSRMAAVPFRLICTLSPRDHEDYVSGDAEMPELFSVVHLREPSQPAAIELVRHFSRGLELEYSLRIDEQAIARSVALSDSYILHQRLPFKAVKILRSICDDLEFDRSQKGQNRSEITGADVLSKVAETCGISPSTLVGVGEGVDYHKNLSDNVVGQQHAVDEVATELGLIKAGMIDAGKPASVMMFVGQTGTGKTEMAKALARLYSSSKRLKTFTLGNFSEPHSVSGIIGVPPGYVGHDQGGRLINELNADPYGVFLLDEADKAHPDVMQPFLNLFDEGWICDQKGNKAYANRAIFILTTNVAQRQIADMCKNGKTVEEITSTIKDSLSRIRHTKSNRPVFTPEFLARVKRIIVFRSLDEAAMHGITLRLVAALREEWRIKRQKNLIIPDVLIDSVAKRAFDLNESAQGREGGRIVRKLLADLVESPVQIAISRAPEAYRRSKTILLNPESVGKLEQNNWSRSEIKIEFESDSAACP